MTTTTETAPEPVKKHARVRGADRAKLAGELAKKYRAGASIRVIAEDSGRSFGFVRRLLLENDVTLRNRGGVVKP